MTANSKSTAARTGELSRVSRGEAIASIIFVLLCALGIWWYVAPAPDRSLPSAGSNADGAASSRYDTPTTHSILGGIRSLPDVDWARLDDNTLYVGFTQRPVDAQSLANAWAIQLNREWDFGAHVFILDKSQNPSGKFSFWATASARHGAIK